MARKIAVITGVSKGIGQALAREFHWHDFHIIGISRTEPTLAVDEWIQADLTSQEDRIRVTSIIKQKYPHIDVLINNAGRGLYESWEQTNIDDLKSVFELNFFSMVHMTQRLIPMLAEVKGTIVNISSVAGKMPIACMGPYCATKYAVNAFSDSLRMEMVPQGIKVLNVKPGRIKTGFSKSCTGSKIAPATPGAKGGPNKLVAKIYKAYIKGDERLIFPSWYKAVFNLHRLFPKWYTKQNLKKWNLENK